MNWRNALFLICSLMFFAPAIVLLDHMASFVGYEYVLLATIMLFNIGLATAVIKLVFDMFNSGLSIVKAATLAISIMMLSYVPAIQPLAIDNYINMAINRLLFSCVALFCVACLCFWDSLRGEV